MKSIKNEKDKNKKRIIKCPSCGKAAPKLSYCENCGTSFKSEHRIATKSVLIFILLVAGLGIGMLSYGFFVGNYITPIPNVNAGLEGNTIRVRGYVTEIEYNERYERTTFEISDTGNNSIEVSGWSEFTTDLKEEGYPEVGDVVIAEGKVDVYQGEASLGVTDADSITIEGQMPEKMSIEEIETKHKYKKVNVTGEIESYNEYHDGDIMITRIRGDSGSISVKTTQDRVWFTEAVGGKPIVLDDNDIGSEVQIIGMVDVYSNSPQIEPTTMTNKSIRFI